MNQSQTMSSILYIPPRLENERSLSDELYFSDIDNDEYELMRFKLYENVKSRQVSV